MYALILTTLLSIGANDASLLVTGPETAACNEPVRLRLEGLPAVDMSKTMQEQLKWIEGVNIIIDAPKGVSEGQYSLDKTLAMKVAPFAWAFNIDFLAKQPGDYIIIVDWNLGPYSLCVHRLSVGDKPVNPDIPVTPPVGPEVPQTNPTSAVLLIETDDLTQKQALVVNQLRNKITNEKLLVLDQHLEAAAKYKKEGQTLPVLLAIDKDKKVVASAPLASSVDEVVKQLEKWGVK